MLFLGLLTQKSKKEDLLANDGAVSSLPNPAPSADGYAAR
jgi:hypothetical protein